MNLIKAAREAKGLSQAELARLSAVKQQTISMLETGERKVPRLDTAQKLAAALNCTIDELVNGDKTATAYSERRRQEEPEPKEAPLA